MVHLTLWNILGFWPHFLFSFPYCFVAELTMSTGLFILLGDKRFLEAMIGCLLLLKLMSLWGYSGEYI